MSRLWELIKMIMRTAVLAALTFVDDGYQRLNAASLFFAMYVVSLIHVEPFRDEPELKRCHQADELSSFILLGLCQILMLLAPSFSSGDHAILAVLTVIPSVCFILWVAQTKAARALHDIEVYIKSNPGAWYERWAVACIACMYPCIRWIARLDEPKKKEEPGNVGGPKSSPSHDSSTGMNPSNQIVASNSTNDSISSSLGSYRSTEELCASSAPANPQLAASPDNEEKVRRCTLDCLHNSLYNVN